ncbi:alcohol dehydrogenase catalytic domain-containing protein [Phycicoccus endophyticus]|uniref:Alcohol dehydrogenase catalytic domain-containing protein n=1 Tax=Phycicoccus endophyticus TaxID=1690220 RepID=A0A7G9R0G6_9MICO|nr:alcohol dehydrogenase catalytic domain-containing protein [Phycicoccus endophyticus]NHI19364.1 alcohol dehydrogenase catalytic domain-containing protein [Phycicoccus endophyticus]QNN49091.1 alcohol dehydrogenase catalytic domain-containing protein [Phycicoccus endophyticus]GGL38501.1 alcohol dehydrogenase [Phycicoccus endophyticus]
MRALVYDAFGSAPRVTELPDPVTPPGGALVRVVAAGLCRSDWHGWMGHDDDIAAFPHVPGHELAGVVEQVGEGVASSWLGRSVTAPFVLACGRCPTCVAGDGQVCPEQRQPGFSDPGCFAELVVVHAADTNLVALPDAVAPESAAGLGCRVATAHRAVTARGRVARDERVLVLGCGGVGLAATALAVARGARVCAVDPDPGARERAAGLGAELTLEGSGTAEEIEAAVRSWSGAGVHVALEAVGSPQACRAGIRSLRRRGRHVQVGLLPGAAGSVELPMDRVIAWELDVLGSHGMAAADYAGLLADVAAGHVDLPGLLAPGGPVGLAEAGRLLTAMGTSPSRGMVLIDPTR